MNLVNSYPLGQWGIGFDVETQKIPEVCPKCATLTNVTYDHRIVKIKDTPIRNKANLWRLKKRRLKCKNKRCGCIFTEPTKGIRKGHRTTQRFKASVTWAAEKYSNLKDVRSNFRCSSRMVYTSFYQTLELRRRRRAHPFPKYIGIDEHSIRKPKYKEVEFATMVVDHSHKRVFELVDGRTIESLEKALNSIPGRENVEAVSLDMWEGYRTFVKRNFPNAIMVCDRFHVVRLFNRLVNRYRKTATGDDRKNPIRKLLLRNSKNLKHYEKSAIKRWLAQYPHIREIYEYKEAICRFYRCRGQHKAKLIFKNLMDRMGHSKLMKVETLRKTLASWRTEILNFHKARISNGRTEGFNRKTKLIQRRGYGYKNFENYRLRVLNDCY
ncbi:MAG: ISL3 family transposase [Bdellovibrionota bacterium]